MIKNCTYVNLGIIVSLANYKLLLTIALPFSSYWTEWWIIKQCPKGLQANGFFPVWVCSCLFKLLLSLIDLSHLEQANGFSPVWVHSCPFKLLLPLNNFSRLEQANASRWSRWPSYGWPRPQCDPRWSGVGAKWSSTLCYHHILWKLALKCTPGAKDVPYGKFMAGRHRPPRDI